jgi:hypothetical protein
MKVKLFFRSDPKKAEKSRKKEKKGEKRRKKPKKAEKSRKKPKKSERGQTSTADADAYADPTAKPLDETN